MTPLLRLALWLDVRPDEVRKVALSSLGAFLVIAFMILARSLREALYLATYPVQTLPYITAAVALLSIPAVGLFARLVSRGSPRRVLMAVLLAQMGGLAVLWPFATRIGIAVIAFYLWTALGALLLTSGFWIVTSEQFPVRGAKRLFGLIGAGGTAGAMIVGNSLVWLTRRFDLIWLVPLLIALLLLFFLAQRWMPPPRGSSVLTGEEATTTSLRDSAAAVWGSPHLRTLALIVASATLASTLLDYQFKELVRAELSTKEQLAGFFGAFYGWTGGLSLAVQLLLTGWLFGRFGLAAGLAVLPAILFLGSAGLVLVPGLALATVARGGDNSLRKSLYRSALEVLYVPVPASLRRKTKTLIDSVVDSLAEGFGAGIIFVWVTWSALPSRYLSVYVMGFAATLFYLSRRMGSEYRSTVADRLRQGGPEAARLVAGLRPEGRDLISGTFTGADLGPLLEIPDFGPPAAPVAGPPLSEARPVTPVEDVIANLHAPEATTVARSLERVEGWDAEHVPALTRLLARDDFYPRAAALLAALGDAAVPHLTSLLRDERTDFVIRRRIPRVLSDIASEACDEALLDALADSRFEVRYRSAVAIMRRVRRGLPRAVREGAPRIWAAVRAEIGRGRPVWELQRVLDAPGAEDDGFVRRRVGARGELSLEHTFRLLALVLEPEPVRAAFHGVVLDDEKLKSLALEYLEQTLPTDVRQTLWPFVGDVSERQRRRARRPLPDVVDDLLTTGATLFEGAEEQEALRRILREPDR